ncbi:sensor histidine kinase [Phyllobacterium zundukense]|uniref:HAMP domain-containing histidine kinase n=1 Tax=Phyllobacterium zundukense TaxID=1867719 RepID=A0ACD4CXQ2_9HYPH|nr:HAMP domain-containing sensor histidine kinase [Phyllobacterium zundukense]UXN58344.1 HAMP domain-containing histidine kinase [Phyllobacterium zundukense]
MTWLHRVKSSRVALRVPLLVALLMIIISAVISDQVLRRLSEMQERNLQGLVESYLDGVSASILPSIMRGDVWEVFDVLDRSASSYASLDLKETIVTGSDGSVIASNHPGNRPSFSQLPQEFLDQFRSRMVEVNQKTMEGFVRRDLLYQGQNVGTIFTILDVSHLMGERRNVLVTLLITNGILACLFAAGGFWLVSYMIRPMRTLENHMRNSSGGMISLIDSSEIPKGDPEVSRLFHRFNELVKSEHEQREFARRLAEEEKLASLGRLSSSMAHEINNPLGGLFNAIDTLKTHGSKPGVRETSLVLIERGLIGIRDVVKAMLATYKYERSQTKLSRDDLNDIQILALPELRRKQQELVWEVDFDGTFSVPAGPIRQAALNLMLNAIAATPEKGCVSFGATSNSEFLKIEVTDEGPGISDALAPMLTNLDLRNQMNPGHGLGLWVIRQILIELGGSATIERLSAGTKVCLIFHQQGTFAHANAA